MNHLLSILVLFSIIGIAILDRDCSYDDCHRHDKCCTVVIPPTTKPCSTTTCPATSCPSSFGNCRASDLGGPILSVCNNCSFSSSITTCIECSDYIDNSRNQSYCTTCITNGVVTDCSSLRVYYHSQ